jgi:hypothetical protein
LDNLLLVYDLSLELMALANDDLEEESRVYSPNEVISVILNHANLASEDPQSLMEAHKTPKWPEWKKAVQIELQQLKDQQTWKLTDLPADHPLIKNKWVFQKKYI